MTALHATIHVGPDGIVRLEFPVEQRNRDVTVTVTVANAEYAPQPAADVAADPWAPYRERLSAAGMSVPPPGSWTIRKAPPLRLPGTPVSQTLVEDRR